MSNVLQEKVLQEVRLGREGFPYPKLRPDGTIGVLDGSIKIPSYISAERVNAIATRFMVVPEQLTMFIDTLVKRVVPAEGIKSVFLLGGPAVGKSFFADLLAYLMTGEKAERFEAANKNLSDMFFVTALDYEANRTYYERISEKYRDGKLSDESIALLKQSFPEKIDEQARSINWKSILSSGENSETTYLAIKHIADLEGINGFASGIGLRTLKSAVPTAWDKKTVVLIDEVTDIKDYTSKSAQLFLQFLKGEIQEVVLASSTGTRVQLTRQELPETFFAVFAGNPAGDAASTKPLPQTLISRMSPTYLDRLTVRGWTHRLCQEMTGLPISTLKEAYKPIWDANPDLFVPYLQYERSAPIFDGEVIPDWQLQLLETPDDVIKAVKMWAEYAYEVQEFLSTYTDSQSQIDAKLEVELNRNYVAEIMPDPRKFGTIIRDALAAVPDDATLSSVKAQAVAKGGLQRLKDMLRPVTQASDWEYEGPMAGFGSRLSREIYKSIINITADKPAMRAYLLGKARDKGLFQIASDGQHITLPRANADRKSFAGLLNVQTKIGNDMRILVRQAKDQIVTRVSKALRKNRAQVDACLPNRVLETAIEARKNDPSILFSTEASLELAQNNSSNLLIGFKAIEPHAKDETIHYESEGRVLKINEAIATAVSTEQFASAFTYKIGSSKVTADALFATRSDLVSASYNEEQRIANGVHEAGYGIAITLTNNQGKPIPVIAIKSEKFAVFLANTDVDAATKKELLSNNIEFLSIRNASGNQIISQIDRIVEGEPDKTVAKRKFANALMLKLDRAAVDKVGVNNAKSLATMDKIDDSIVRLLQLAATETSNTIAPSVAMRVTWQTNRAVSQPV